MLKKHKQSQNEFRLRIPSWHNNEFVFTKTLNYPGYPETPKQIEIIMKKIVEKNNFKY